MNKQTTTNSVSHFLKRPELWLFIVVFAIVVGVLYWLYGGQQQFAACESFEASFSDSEHPLAGKIWDVKQQEWRSCNDLVGELSDANFVLLGQQLRDVKQRERNQFLTQALLELDREHLSVVLDDLAGQDFVKVIYEYEADDNSESLQQDKRIKRLVEKIVLHTGSGDIARSYRPLLEEIFEQELQLWGGDITMFQKEVILKQGLGVLDASVRQLFKLNTQLTADHQQYWVDHFTANYCIPSEAARNRNYFAVQRARMANITGKFVAGQVTSNTVVALTEQSYIHEQYGLRAKFEGLGLTGTAISVGQVYTKADLTEVADYTDHIAKQGAEFVIFAAEKPSELTCNFE